MVAAGDVPADNHPEDDGKQDGSDGDACHDACRMLADVFPFGLLTAEHCLVFVLDGGEQLMDFVVQFQAVQAKLLHPVVECPHLLLLSVRHSCLHVFQKRGNGICRAITFGDGVDVFFLDGIVHKGGIFL